MKAVKKSDWSLVIVWVVLLILMTFAPNVFAQQGTPSSKATARINTVLYCNVANATSTDPGTAPMTCKDVFSGDPVQPGADNFVDVMTTVMKVSNRQSLFVSPSLVTGLYTNTLVRTKTGGASTATAQGGVYLRAVLRDPASGNVVRITDRGRLCQRHPGMPALWQRLWRRVGLPRPNVDPDA